MVSPTIRMGDYVSAFLEIPIRAYAGLEPWLLTQQAESIVRRLLNDLHSEEFDVLDEIAVHRTARVEKGAVLKGPLILGPGAELKSSFVFPGTKLAHFNFVGDSVLGADVNLEAGSVPR